MSRFSPLAVDERNAAKLLDLDLPIFRALVVTRVLPPGREIAPGVVRWLVDDLRRIVGGDAVEGMGEVQW